LISLKGNYFCAIIGFKKAGDGLAEQTVKIKQSVEQIVDDMTLFDDDLMSMVFDGNVEATELLLRIILDKSDIKVLSVVGQRDMKNPLVGGRNIRIDIHAQDSSGRHFDIEVQRSNAGAHFRRARFHSSMMDSRMLKSGQEFEELLDSYMIFITEKDKIGKGRPLYHIDRTIAETGESFDDGSHIIYVNGSYKGDDAIGKLMHDFGCKESVDIYYQELAKGVKHFKEEEGGRKRMCEAVKEYAQEAVEAKAESMAIKMLKAGKYAIEEIADLTELSISQIQMLQKNI
jgi:hypothetical protein